MLVALATADKSFPLYVSAHIAGGEHYVGSDPLLLQETRSPNSVFNGVIFVKLGEIFIM